MTSTAHACKARLLTVLHCGALVGYSYGSKLSESEGAARGQQGSH